MRVKNWKRFQHFKDRRPPWIKLYRDLLDDADWFNLSGDSKGVLIMLWLIASEDKENAGNIPAIRQLAFRLRMSEQKAKQSLSALSGWLEHDDIDLISERYQNATPETETETERETDPPLPPKGGFDGFENFWKEYPKKIGKGAAEKSWEKIKPVNGLVEQIIKAVISQKRSDQWTKDGGQYIPHPSTWLNQKRWLDEGFGRAPSPEDEAERKRKWAEADQRLKTVALNALKTLGGPK